MALPELLQLVERAGGRQRVLLVAEGGEPGAPEPSPALLLGAFARELLGPPPPPEQDRAQDPAQDRAQQQEGARRVRVRIGGGGDPGRPPCALLVVLVRARSLLPPRWGPERRRRLREILRDLRGRLPGGCPAVVGVAVWEAAPGSAPGSAPSGPDPPSPAHGGCCADPEAARAQLEALLRRVFVARRRRRPQPGIQETLQAATYRPGGGQGAAQVRQAAARALRAALRIRADEVAAEKQRLPILLQCIPWNRPRRQSEGRLDAAAHEFREDALQDVNKDVALTNMTPNGKCEETHGKSSSEEVDEISSNAALSR